MNTYEWIRCDSSLMEEHTLDVVVVGGGIAGILSSCLLKRKFRNVTLLEKDHTIGGLYRSIQADLGQGQIISFDHGSHFLRETGMPNLDEVLFGDLEEGDWHFLGNLKGAGFYGSTLNEKSPFIDARRLAGDDYQRGMEELMEIGALPSEPGSLDEELRQTFGHTLTEKLFEPVLKGKFYGCDLKELAVHSHGLFGLGRILGLTVEETREIKKVPRFDAKFAFHSSNEGASEMRNFYPRRGGIQTWIDGLQEKIEEQGVRILCDTSVDEVISSQGKVSSVRANNNEIIPCDLLVWTVPVPAFLKATHVVVPKGNRPRLLHTYVFHYVFDEAFETNAHYIQCHEPHLKTFRVTLYPNIQGPAHPGLFHATSEVISSVPLDPQGIIDEVAQELRIMGVVPSRASVLWSSASPLTNGFPFPTIDFKVQQRNQLNMARESCSNAVFLGRNAGNGFVANQVLPEVYTTLLEWIGTDINA